MSNRQRHSYVPFYMDDWAAATSGMTRPMWSVLFQICQYNWDKVRPVPAGRMRMMVADLPDGMAIVDCLVDGQAVELDDRGYFSPRALAEGEKALDLWQRKSKGGRHSPARVSEDSSKSHRADSDSDSDSDSRDSPNGESTPPTPSSKKAPMPVVHMVQDAWNEMARSCGLSPIVKLTDARITHVRARIGEYGANEIIDAIRTIPDSGFLTGKNDRGWKLTFDSLLEPNKCARLLEGSYHNRGNGSAWTR